MSENIQDAKPGSPKPIQELLAMRLPEHFPLRANAAERCKEWFNEAGLGLFIHWDQVSQQGIEISWTMVGGVYAVPGGGTLTTEKYYSTSDTFNPTEWDPQEMAHLAKAAGCTYVVLGVKHHVGWTLWPSKVGKHSIASSIYGKKGGDLLRTYVDAVRGEGLKVGVYYSLCDWGHEDYLEWKDEYLPYIFGTSSPRGTDEQWQRFRKDLKEQLKEILTDYGQIDLLWFDGGWERSIEDWDMEDLGKYVRSLSPKTLVNDRLYSQGDFRTPEQSIPPVPLPEKWEACMTMNYSWGYVATDTAFKTPYEILRTLIEIVSRGGNLLLNIGPRGDGSLVPEERTILQDLAKWMQFNKESVIGVEPGLEPWQFYGPSTRRDNLIYLHQFAIPIDSVVVRAIKVKRVKSVRNLTTGEELKFIRRTAINDPLLEDPDGEIIIDVRGGKVSGLMPVIVVDLGGDPSNVTHRNW